MYKRLTNNNLEEYNPEYDFCVGCKHFGEPNGCNRPNGTCGNYERFIETYNRLAELEDKIENGTLKEVDNKVYPPNTSIGVWGDYCSKCGGLIGENGYEENYCSHCGAKLKEINNVKDNI